MPDIITFSCPSCGDLLFFKSDIDRTTCAASGNECIVNRVEGMVTQAPMKDGITKDQFRIDKTDAELAINGLRTEISDVEEELKNKS
jgi:hypothetical protein